MSDKKEWVIIPTYPKFETDRVSVRSVKNKNIQTKQGSKYRLYHENGERHTISLEDVIALVDGKPAEVKTLLQSAQEKQTPISKSVSELLTDKDRSRTTPAGPLSKELLEAKALEGHKPELTDKAKDKIATDKKSRTPKEKKERVPGVKDAVLKLHAEGKTVDEMCEANPTWKRNTVYIIVKIASGKGTKKKTE